MKRKKMKCKECETLYSPVEGFGVPSVFCHVRCYFAHEKKVMKQKQDEKKLKKEIEYKYNPSTCAFCEKKFINNHHARVYCSDECRKAKEKKIKDSKEKKKNIPKYLINSFLEKKRLKNDDPAFLKKFNSCRG